MDANAKPLEKPSMKATRKPAKGGLANAMFVQAAVEDLPVEFDGVADEIHIHFPWGSLLRAVATGDAADRAFHRVVDRTVGCSGQTSAMHLDNFTTQVWTFTGGPPSATDADWVKQEAGTDRRCFTTTRKRENVLLQAKVCQAGNGGPAVNVLAGAMQNTLGQ